MESSKRIRVKCPFCAKYIFVKKKSKIWITITNFIINFILARKNKLTLKQQSHTKVLNICHCSYCKKRFWVYSLKSLSGDGTSYILETRSNSKSPLEINLTDWILRVTYF